MRRKINVTASEMMELRKQGMSNYDIAKSLDISCATVRRYIGTQGGKKMERLEAFKDKPSEKKQAEAPVFVPYTPKKITEQFGIGEDIVLEVDYEEREITIANNEASVFIPFRDICDLTQFLAWLMRERDIKTEGVADAE